MNPITRSLSAVALGTAALCFAGAALAQGKAASPAPAAAPSAQACPPLLQHRFPRLQDGAPQDLCQYKGRVLLVVNTASYCGFTNQYEGLEALHARYADKGLVVMGFPSNDFGQQEPGNAKAIADLCFNTYGVRFPMFDKTVVAGPQANPLYAQLTKATGVSPQWNFHKYLVGRDGRVLANFPSAMAPTSSPVVKAVEAALQQRP
ncbi:glutathione peroxidase [Hydrogenophaga sp. XSHU_21]